MNNALYSVLKEKVENEESRLNLYVLSDILSQGEDDFESYMKDVLKHGCVSGIVTGLIYYKDTHEFFDTHYEEIEELRTSILSNSGINLLDYIGNNDLKNHMAWIAYEETLREIVNELGNED